jgi:hypothetical protein
MRSTPIKYLMKKYLRVYGMQVIFGAVGSTQYSMVLFLHYVLIRTVLVLFF